MAIGLLAWLAGSRLGWIELFYVASVCLVLLGVGFFFMLGRTVLEVSLVVQPARVFVGGVVSGELKARNSSRGRLLPLQIDLPVSAATARFGVPSLPAEAEHTELFVVPTDRRAVIRVGPASAVRADPLGLLRREAVRAEITEIYVHPTIVPLQSFGAGLLRDLEGQSTKDISTSDLAFYALRDYVPGDDQRYVHWLSTAKAGKLLVRQFLDTRRSSLALIVDSNLASYGTTNDAELAMSLAGSIAVRAVSDEVDVFLLAGGQTTSGGASRTYLDALSRASLNDAGDDLTKLARQASQVAHDTSIAILVTGDVVGFADIRGAALRFGPDVAVFVIRVEPTAPPGISRSNGLTVLGLRQLADLPLLLATAAMA